MKMQMYGLSLTESLSLNHTTDLMPPTLHESSGSLPIPPLLREKVL